MRMAKMLASEKVARFSVVDNLNVVFVILITMIFRFLPLEEGEKQGGGI